MRGGGAALPPKAVTILKQLGLVRPDMSAQQLTKNLVGALLARGFGGGGGPLAQQLSAALAAFQRANGLPPSGQLDAKTAQLLQQSGALPRAAGGLGVKDGFEGARAPAKDAAQALGKEQSQGPQQLFAGAMKAAADGSPQSMQLLSGLLGLGGGGLAAGNQGGEGAAPTPGQAQVALADGAGQGIAAKAEGHNANARVDGSGLSRSLAGAPAQKGASEQTRGKPGAQDARRRGLEEDGDDAEDGLEDGEGKGSGQGGGEGGGAEDGASAQGARAGDQGGSERLSGNASSGDARDDDERGNASFDEGSGGAGHHRMPPIAVQWRRALDEVRRQGGTQNRATTYSWDVRFYRPAVYGAGQKAEEILHVVVQDATAFDRAWPRAVEALSTLARRYDGDDADLPLEEDVLRAIRKARVT
jgi:hypothetical protein